MTLDLLPRESLIKTGAVDHAAWNYAGVLGYVSRRRFALVRSLLPKRPVSKLLEVGYGSGVFLPELAKVSRDLYGADVHTRPAEVTAVLARAGIRAQLVSAPAEHLPFADGMFDIIVAVSTFEFVTDAGRAIRELARTLTPDGRIIVVTPGQSPLLDIGLRIFTGESAKADFGDRRSLVVPTLLTELRHDRSTYFPARFPVPIYRALRLAKHSRPSEGSPSV